MKHALVICTRNRVRDLIETVESIVDQRGAQFRLFVIDASDPQEFSHNKNTLSALGEEAVHLHYATTPSLARQRNVAIEIVGADFDVIHFLDDDVTLPRDYVSKMEKAFHTYPEAAAIGASLFEKGRLRSRPNNAWLLRLFFLHGDEAGRVLISGHDSPAQLVDLPGTQEVEWLNGCSAYRTSAIGDLRCDDKLQGYSMDEDLDFSYRVGRGKMLLVEPSIKIVHRKGVSERSAPPSYFSDYLIHRYWFVEKNVSHPMKKIAFWWSTLGRILRAIVGGGENRKNMLEGYRSGMRQIVKRSHYLLS